MTAPGCGDQVVTVLDGASSKFRDHVDVRAKHGYADHWDEEDVLHYYGAGQFGDMVFERGNLAIRDADASGKEIHLFEKAAQGLRYFGFVTCGGYYEIDAPDTGGATRRAIVFQLVPVDGRIASPEGGDEHTHSDANSDRVASMDKLREKLRERLGVQPNSRLAKQQVYIRSDTLKTYVRRRANGTCEGCGSPAPFKTTSGLPYLEPHHTRRLADGGPDDFHHVIALCPTCHRRVHHAHDRPEYNNTLKDRLKQIETT